MKTLYYPENLNARALEIETEIEKTIDAMLEKGSAPSTPAIDFFLNKKYSLGIYRNFGQGLYSFELGRDLLSSFEKRAEGESSRDRCFWAVFDKSDDLSEVDFERCLLNELSYMTSYPEFIGSWETQWQAEAFNKSLRICLRGISFEVFGFHPFASSDERRFPKPTLIFSPCEEDRAPVFYKKQGPRDVFLVKRQAAGLW